MYTWSSLCQSLIWILQDAADVYGEVQEGDDEEAESEGEEANIDATLHANVRFCYYE